MDKALCGVREVISDTRSWMRDVSGKMRSEISAARALPSMTRATSTRMLGLTDQLHPREYLRNPLNAARDVLHQARQISEDLLRHVSLGFAF